MNPVSRRLILGAAAAFAAAGARAAITDSQGDDMGLGSSLAPVTVIEYASVGCPHCAAWSRDVFPAFKARYIDTRRVYFVMREVLTGNATLATAGFLLARCAGKDKYFPVIEEIFRRQDDFYAPGATPGLILEDIAKGQGVGEDAFRACLTDQSALNALNVRSDRHGNVDGVDSTPTFFVNGKRLDGEQSLDALGAAIRAARVRRSRR